MFSTKGHYFVLKRKEGDKVYVVSTEAGTFDIGDETDPRGFLRALVDGTVLSYLEDQARQRTPVPSSFWAPGTAKHLQDQLASTNAFVLDNRTLYSAPGMASLAEALKNRNLFNSVYDQNHNLLPGRALPDILNAAATEWRPPAQPPVEQQPPVEEQTVSVGNDPELDRLRTSVEGQPKEVTPDALKGATGNDPIASPDDDSGDKDLDAGTLPFPDGPI